MAWASSSETLRVLSIPKAPIINDSMRQFATIIRDRPVTQVDKAKKALVEKWKKNLRESFCPCCSKYDHFELPDVPETLEELKCELLRCSGGYIIW